MPEAGDFVESLELYQASCWLVGMILLICPEEILWIIFRPLLILYVVTCGPVGLTLTMLIDTTDKTIQTVSYKDRANSRFSQFREVA